MNQDMLSLQLQISTITNRLLKVINGGNELALDNNVITFDDDNEIFKKIRTLIKKSIISINLLGECKDVQSERCIDLVTVNLENLTSYIDEISELISVDLYIDIHVLSRLVTKSLNILYR